MVRGAVVLVVVVVDMRVLLVAAGVLINVVFETTDVLGPAVVLVGFTVVTTPPAAVVVVIGAFVEVIALLVVVVGAFVEVTGLLVVGVGAFVVPPTTPQVEQFFTLSAPKQLDTFCQSLQ